MPEPHDQDCRIGFMPNEVLDRFVADVSSLSGEVLRSLLPAGLNDVEVAELGGQVAAHAAADPELVQDDPYGLRAEDGFLSELGIVALNLGDLITAGSVRVHLKESLGWRGKASALLLGGLMYALARKTQ